MQLKASAPGSFMLLGEYAVLHGKYALVCAVDKRVTVILTPREDDQIEIHSTLYGNYTTNLARLTIEKPFHFILGTLKHYQAKMRRGCSISIETDFSDKIGLGSSAAVTVATLAALVSWLNIRMSALDLVRQGRIIVRSIQGTGSGADIAASVYGGMVGYLAQPLSAEKFSAICPLTALYTGFKASTADAIQFVQTHFAALPNLFRSISTAIGQCAIEGLQFARKEQWQKLGEVMNVQQGMMESLGVSTPLLRDMVHHLRAQTGILGAKISGAGLGDCVIGLGELPESYQFVSSPDVKRIPVSMTSQGVHCEKI